VADFAKAAATAKRLIEANGRAVTLRKLNRTPDDVAKPWNGSTATPSTGAGGVVAAVTMAFVPPSGSGLGKLIQDVEGELVAGYDQVGLVATDSLPAGVTAADMEKAETVTDGADAWRVISRAHLKPADRSVLFAFALKK